MVLHRHVCIVFFIAQLTNGNVLGKLSIRDLNNRVNFHRVFYMRKIVPTARAGFLMASMQLIVTLFILWLPNHSLPTKFWKTNRHLNIRLELHI